LLSVDILTADGDLLHASETTNSDLFWGMRGAGHNFGIVTSFQFKLNDLRPDVARMLLLFSPDRADEVTTFIDQFLEEATRDLFVSLAFMLSPGEAPFPEQLAGQPALAVSLMHFGSEEAAERELESFVELGGWELARARIPYLELQTMFDEANAWGKRFYMKSGFMGEVRPGFVDTCLKAMEGSPREDGADNMVGVWAWGGAIADVDEGATAFSGRTAKYWLGPETIWHHASEDSAHFSWGRSTMEALSSFLSSGNYINDIADSGESLVKAAYGEPKYRRLVDLKRTYDPKNFFSLNQNIRP
jgi:FAD/FMN-containing dehydrogenase